MTSVMPRKKDTSFTPADKAKADDLIARAKADIVLDHPFFATIMMKKPMVESSRIPTLAVTPSGVIHYNPAFIAKQTRAQVTWAIAHEVLHYASGDSLRRGARDPRRWNYACDAVNNDILNQSRVGERIPGCIDMPGSANKTQEQVYDELPNEQGDGPGDEDGDEPCDGPSGGGDNPLDGDIDSDEEGDEGSSHQPTPEELDAERKITVAEAAQVAKAKGKLPGVIAKFAANVIDSKVPWYDVLERYMTERVRNDYSWARPNRRYMPDYYLPTIDGVGAMGEVVFQVDVSGSISPEEIAHYNGHIKRIVEQCHPVKVHVTYVDTHVQRHDVFDKPEDVEITHFSGGGTDMEAGFRWLDREGIEPEVVVVLTDGYTDYTKSPDVPVVWCVSTDIQPTYGETIHFTKEN